MSDRCLLYPQKQTFAAVTGMSALCQKQTFASFDHLVGTCEDRWRDCETNRLSRREIDDQFKFGRLFNGYIAGFCPT